MAIHQAIVARIPIEDVEVSYSLLSASRRGRKARFAKARLLTVTRETMELGSREAFHPGEKLSLVVNTKRIKDFLRIDGEITKSSRVTVLRQQAYAVEVALVKPNAAQQNKLAWATTHLAPKEKPDRLGRKPQERAKEKAAPPAAAQSADTAKDASGAPPDAKVEAETAGEEVVRPQALLDLISTLDTFEVSNDLIWAVIEAAEAGMDVEVLFPVAKKDTPADEEAEEEEEVAAPLPPGQARPINVYRLAGNTTLHFSSKGMPVSPPSDMFYYSGLKSPQTCFALNLELDFMAREEGPSFKVGSVLLFSTKAPVTSGDYVYLKVRGKDVFAKVLFGKDDTVRIRFLNQDYPERQVKRREVRMMYKLIGAYQSS